MSDYSNYRIGIFDSGRGGDYVALEISEVFVNIKIINLNDSANIPYGLKTPQELFECIKPFIAEFNRLEVDVIIIACNTCYINLEDQIRQLTNIEVIGYRPPLELAVSQSSNKTIVTCATRATLLSQCWQELKQTYVGYKLIDIDCTHWVSLVEQSQITNDDLKFVINQIVDNQADSLILGCTHYHQLRDNIISLLPKGYKLGIYEASSTVFKQLKQIL